MPFVCTSNHELRSSIISCHSVERGLEGIIGMSLVCLSLSISQNVCSSVCHFLVCSISPEPFEIFSLHFGQIFISLRLCAELMSQLHRLKIKVTGKGHGMFP